ncbi:MAG: hypothetical protein IT230_13410 [Flavobacteriales bacterium]|nr:hypothetical protein [Flavobacteriales bacterium]
MCRLFLTTVLLLGFSAASRAQQAVPPAHLADALCSCMGSIDPQSDDRSFDLAVRHCLSTAMMTHSGEVIELMRRYPSQDRQLYLLGLLLGGALDRSCPDYPLIRERLLPRFSSEKRASPSI